MQLLEAGVEEWGLALAPEQVQAFEFYYQQLIDWNERVNLTSITDYEEVQVKHFLDSLSCLQVLGELSLQAQCIDIGAGAGFPGLPIKIACPQMKLTLLEAPRKKVLFLEHIVNELGLRDVKAAFDRDPAARGLEEIVLSYPGVLAVTIYRLAHELWLQEVPFIPRMMTECAHSITGIDIHPGATIGSSFFIDHGTGVVIGETTEIGDNVTQYQGVTLGGYRFRRAPHGSLERGYKRHPTIQDGVIIYAGATILGGDTVVGAGSVVGGSVWLTHSVPPKAVVMIQDPDLKYKVGY